MSVTADQLWNLTVVSGLVAAEHRSSWEEQFRSTVEAPQQSDVKTLAKWLVEQNVISRYQVGVLLAGKSGPFQYGDYQIYDRITDGAWKGSYRAVHAPTRHPVTLRFVPTKSLQINSWQNITNVVAARHDWQHPTHLKCHAAVEYQKYRILVFDDFPPGESLGDRLQRGPIDAQEAARIVRIVALGLVSVHNSGQCHGDIRPDNIWLSPQGDGPECVSLICDPTNIPSALTGEIALDQANYRAPECPLPTPANSPLCDTYALGCLFYHCVAGQPPFADGDVAFKQQCHATQPIQRLDKEQVSDGLMQLITYMMAKNAAVRYQQISDVAEQIVPFLDSAHLKIPTRGPSATETAFAEAIANAPAANAPTVNSPADPLAADPSASGASASGASGAGPVIRTTPASTGRRSRSGAKPRPKFDNLSPTTTGEAAPSPVAPSPVAPSPVAPSPVAPSPVATPPPASPPVLPPAQPTIATPPAVVSATPAPASPGAASPGAASPGAASLGRATSSGGQAERIRQQKRRQRQMLVITVIAAGLLSGGGYFGYQQWLNRGAATADDSTSDGDSTDERQRPVEDVVKDDDGQFLWASPTNGKPLDLSMLPFESLAIIAIRPQSILASEEGPRVFKSLGPAFQQWRAKWENQVGFPLEEIDQLIVSLHPRGDDLPEAAYVVTLASEVERASLLSKLGDPQEKPTDEDSYYEGGNIAAYLPEGDSIQRFAIGSPDRMKEVAELAGAPPPARTGTEPLLRASDQDRHLSILFVPFFVSTNLLRDGREYYFGEAKKAREPLDWLLGAGIKAGMFSVHFDGNTYVELQINSDVTKNPYKVASDLRGRVNEMPLMIETYIATKLNPPVYWRQLAFRYPDMIQFLHDETRIQVEGKLAVVNAILPPVAAHNLTAGGELLLASQPQELMVVGGDEKKIPQTLEELLQTESKLAFAQQSFENVIRTIESDIIEKYPELPFYFDIKVIGPDLEGNGITRNKEVKDFDAEGTVADVLTALCVKVNPVTTVKIPGELDQKLLWVIGPDPDDESKTVILITSRDAATAKNYTLPEIFRVKEPAAE